MDTDNKQASKSGDHRHSCLVAFLAIFALVVVFGGILAALLYFAFDHQTLALGDSLGVIEIQGVITDSESTIKALNKFRKNDSIKAVILRIDSPGGGVAATQEIYREIERLKKEKKVIASMGSVAASGGLYVAAPADRILANPATVTGSIGVIMNTVNVEDLLGKVGLAPVVIKSGKFKDIGSSTRPMSEEERALLQQVIDEMHHQFVVDLAKGRKLPEDKVAALADGRIFTGAKAKELGLVDDLGNFRDAINLAKTLSGLSDDPKLVYPERDGSWLEEILKTQSSLSVVPLWIRQPISFQYLYWPGL